MRRRTADLWIGAIGLVVLILVIGVLLIRASSGGSSAHDRASRATTWSRYAVTGDRLRVEFEGSPCDTGEASLDEKADRVVVTVHLRASDQMCVALAAGHQADVQLSSPLGTRPVYDGTCLQRSDVPDDPACQRSTADQPTDQPGES